MALLVTAAPLRDGLSTQPGHTWQRLALVAATVLAIAAADVVPSTGWLRTVAGFVLVGGVALSVLSTGTVNGMHDMTPAWIALPQAVSAIALGVLIGGARASAGARRTGGAARSGMLVLFVGCLLFAATQATSLPFTPEQVVIALAVVGAALVIPGRARSAGSRRMTWAAPAACVVAVLVGIARCAGTWLVRQLSEARGETRLDAYVAGSRTSTTRLLRDVRDEPQLLVEDTTREIRWFDVTMDLPSGSKRGVGRGSLIESVQSAVDNFYVELAQNIRPWVSKPPRMVR